MYETPLPPLKNKENGYTNGGISIRFAFVCMLSFVFFWSVTGNLTFIRSINNTPPNWLYFFFHQSKIKQTSKQLWIKEGIWEWNLSFSLQKVVVYTKRFNFFFAHFLNFCFRGKIVCKSNENEGKCLRALALVWEHKNWRREREIRKEVR